MEKQDTAERIEDVSDPEAASTGEDQQQDAHMSLQAYLALAAVSSQYVAYVLTLLMPSTIVSYINADLGPDPNYTWINVSWNLAASVMVTLGGRLSDIFGRRYFMITGACIALIGAVVGATGKSINQMIASGALFGIGGGLQEMAFACVQEIVPDQYRILAIGIFESTALLAFVSPMIAYTMIARTALGWRTVYWFLFSFEACGLLLVIFCYKPPTFHTKHRADGKSRWQLVKEMDFVGFLLFASGAVLFLIGVNYGGRQYAWSSAPVISTIVVGAGLLIALGFWEAYAKLKYPMLPSVLFKNVRGFTMVLVICFVGGMLYYSMNVLWPRQSGLLFVPSDQPIIAGVYANMVSFGTIMAGLIVIFFCHKVGHERWQQVGFMAVQTALIGSLSTIGVNDRAQAIVTIIILAMSITPPQLLAFVMIAAGLDDQVDIGVANGLASTFRLMGGAVATAIYSAILSNRFAQQLPVEVGTVVQEYQLPSRIVPQLLQAGTTNSAAGWKALSEVAGVSAAVLADLQMAVKMAYVQAFRLVYLVAIAFGILAVICAAFTKSIPAEKKLMQRAVRMENESRSEGLEKV
ncbi:Trichothecene efflux pump TRI12 [Pseudocercospora fuligena]|uniref:Trichothecene efflux pump TRI12 n=1 Tax=Pseudocercospora fuligena TaxID=685502 RepID=A0A8H6RUC2_9PEZI|nr:Trichothecene efflux pump TRI12 [Pseudocercospora fuligena]